MQLLSVDSRTVGIQVRTLQYNTYDTVLNTTGLPQRKQNHENLADLTYSRQQARNMVTPTGETSKEMLSLADTKRTVPRLSISSERPVGHVAVAWPSVTRRMLALSTGEMVYCGREGRICQSR